MDTTIDAIALSERDNVATVLRPVEEGETIAVRAGGAILRLTSREAIPLCHKIGLTPIAPGDGVIKYGQRIGSATAPIAAGRHVHIHNLRSDRALADAAGPR